VADDQTLVRAGFRVLVDSAPDLEVVGEAGDGAQAVELARQQLPDVVLMDIRMPRMDGLEDLVVGALQRPTLGRWLPEGAASALTAPGDGTLAMWAGGLVFAAYGLILALLGGRLVVGRDLT
jgi:CheY-like chemotaxis protein